MGFRVLSVDGSMLGLPDHPSLCEKFSRHGFGSRKNVHKWMSRISYLYDVLNNVVFDAQMESFDTSGAALCDNNLGFLCKGDLVIFDRYYASHYLFSTLAHKQVRFFFRMRDHSWACVRELVGAGLDEQVVDLDVYKYSKVTKKIPSNANRKVRVRLIKHISRSGKVHVYATFLIGFGQVRQKVHCQPLQAEMGHRGGLRNIEGKVGHGPFLRQDRTRRPIGLLCQHLPDRPDINIQIWPGAKPDGQGRANPGNQQYICHCPDQKAVAEGPVLLWADF